MIAQKYWEISTGCLKLSKLNELIQSNRDNALLVAPLLKALTISAEIEESESCGEMLNLLRSQFMRHDYWQHESLINTIVMAYKRIEPYLPQAKSE